MNKSIIIIIADNLERLFNNSIFINGSKIYCIFLDNECLIRVYQSYDAIFHLLY